MKTVITTDFHAHILPGADHGSEDVETSLRQLEMIASYGIKRVVATPHFYPMKDHVDLYLETRTDCARELRKAMYPGLPSVMLGAEVLVCEGMERMPGLEKLTIFGTKCILLEMPTTKWTDTLYDTVSAIASSGLTPIMAHVDRYDAKKVEQLFELGVKAQLNPGAFFTRKARSISDKWLREGRIVAVGSDLHRVNAKEYRGFGKAINSLGSFAPVIDQSMKRLLDGAKQIVVK